jgi:hypothetical protein
MVSKGAFTSDLFKIVRSPMSALDKLDCGKPSAVSVERVTNRRACKEATRQKDPS